MRYKQGVREEIPWCSTSYTARWGGICYIRASHRARIATFPVSKAEPEDSMYETCASAAFGICEA